MIALTKSKAGISAIPRCRDVGLSQPASVQGRRAAWPEKTR
jgi:hypothetical protein